MVGMFSVGTANRNSERQQPLAEFFEDVPQIVNIAPVLEDPIDQLVHAAVRHLRNDALQPVADRAVAFGEADERPQHDLAAVVDGIPAGLGDVVVADVLGMDVDGAEVPGIGHLLRFPAAALLHKW